MAGREKVGSHPLTSVALNFKLVIWSRPARVAGDGQQLAILSHRHVAVTAKCSEIIVSFFP